MVCFEGACLVVLLLLRVFRFVGVFCLFQLMFVSGFMFEGISAYRDTRLQIAPSAPQAPLTSVEPPATAIYGEKAAFSSSTAARL